MSSKLTFQEKTILISDLKSTFTIWSRDHGLEEAIFIATGGRTRSENVQIAIGDAVEAIGAEAGVRRVIEHAIRTIESGD